MELYDLWNMTLTLQGNRKPMFLRISASSFISHTINLFQAFTLANALKFCMNLCATTQSAGFLSSSSSLSSYPLVYTTPQQDEPRTCPDFSDAIPLKFSFFHLNPVPSIKPILSMKIQQKANLWDTNLYSMYYLNSHHWGIFSRESKQEDTNLIFSNFHFILVFLFQIRTLCFYKITNSCKITVEELEK